MRAAVGLVTALGLAVSALSCDAASVASLETQGAIQIDRKRQEIRFPCRFVNPTRLIEVFACHKSGPTHETVVEFDVTGPEIYRALIAVGCRTASYWNATHPEAALKNQGDRLLVLVKWEYGGKVKEYPAEGMLLDGEIKYPSFVRGFSFGARTAEGAAETEKIPEGVEISLLATNRQSPSFALLSHPTNSKRLRWWMLPPLLDESVVEHHNELVEKGVAATLIIRRVKSEVELLEYARSVAAKRGLAERAPLYAQLQPIAAEIDKLKLEYEEVIGRLRALLPEGDTQGEEVSPETVPLVFKQIQHGNLLCDRIEEQYLTLYDLQESLKLAWLEKKDDLPLVDREEAIASIRYGVHMERLIGAKELERALLRAGARSDTTFLEQATGKEVQGLQLEREIGFAEWNLKYTLWRLEGEESPWTRELFLEDKMKWEAQLQALRGKLRLNRTEVKEFRAKHEKRWKEAQAKILAERGVAKKAITVGELKLKLVDYAEEIRWAKSDSESGSPKQREEARAKLKEFNAKKRGLEEEIEKARRELEAIEGS